MNNLSVSIRCKISQFLFLVIMFLSSCQGAEVSLFRLSKAGYTPDSNSLLVSTRGSLRGTETEKLFIINLDTRIGQLIDSPPAFSFDFAWVPGEERFVSTHANRIVLYRKESSQNSYFGTAIKCPINVLYLHCSWSPDGKYLAIICFDYKTSNYVVGIYDSSEEEFKLTGINGVKGHLVWKNNTTLYTFSNNNVVELKLEDERIKVVRTIAKHDDSASGLHGIVHGQAVVERYEDVMLGEKSLLSVTRPGGCRVAVTQDMILISTKSALVAFDYGGREIARTDSKRIVHFGPVDTKNNQVLGISGSMLLSIQISKDSINVHDKLELSKVQWMVQEDGEWVTLGSPI